MNVIEFKEYFRELLANSGNPAIAGVDFYDVPDNEYPLQDLVVRGTDDVSLYLSIVRTSPPGGDKAGEPVQKSEPGVKVIDG